MPNKFYVAGRNQTKTVTPSNTTQTVTPSDGYNALDAVVVEPIAALMPQSVEEFVMRDSSAEPFSLNLNGAVPDYACYQQSLLKAVYGNPTSIGAYAFNYCSSLQSIDFSNVNYIGNYAFGNCSGLTKVDIQNYTGYLSDSAFRSCYGLITVDARNVTSVGPYSFSACSSLIAIDIRNATELRLLGFQNCQALHLMDITNSHSASLNSSNSIPNNTDLTVLVADATDKAYYQSATNWSAHASQIKTVAEFEQEIGKSYDVYYEEIFGHPRFDS